MNLPFQEKNIRFKNGKIFIGRKYIDIGFKPLDVLQAQNILNKITTIKRRDIKELLSEDQVRRLREEIDRLESRKSKLLKKKDLAEKESDKIDKEISEITKRVSDIEFENDDSQNNDGNLNEPGQVSESGESEEIEETILASGQVEEIQNSSENIVPELPNTPEMNNERQSDVQENRVQENAQDGQTQDNQLGFNAQNNQSPIRAEDEVSNLGTDSNNLFDFQPFSTQHNGFNLYNGDPDSDPYLQDPNFLFNQPSHSGSDVQPGDAPLDLDHILISHEPASDPTFDSLLYYNNDDTIISDQTIPDRSQASNSSSAPEGNRLSYNGSLSFQRQSPQQELERMRREIGLIYNPENIIAESRESPIRRRGRGTSYQPRVTPLSSNKRFFANQVPQSRQPQSRQPQNDPQTQNNLQNDSQSVNGPDEELPGFSELIAQAEAEERQQAIQEEQRRLIQQNNEQPLLSENLQGGPEANGYNEYSDIEQINSLVDSILTSTSDLLPNGIAQNNQQIPQHIVIQSNVIPILSDTFLGVPGEAESYLGIDKN